MQNRNKTLYTLNIFHLGIVLAILFWLLETAIHVWFFHPGESRFIDELITEELNELWMRMLISVLIITTGYFAEKRVKHIRKASAQISDILDSTTDAYVAVDKEWRVTYANSRALDLFSTRKEQLYNHIFWDVLPEMSSSFYLPLKRSMDERRAIIQKGFYSPADLWLDAHAYPNSKGMAFFFRDITQEKGLDETRLQLQSIVDHSADGIITISKYGIIRSFSKAAEHIFGYSAEEVIGKNVSMLMTEEHAPHHDGYLKNHMHSGQAKLIGIGPVEVKARRKDGSVFDVDLAINKAQICDEVIFIGNVRDISQRKEMEIRLEHMSLHDSLTDLPNRTLLFDRFHHAIESARRNKYMLAVMYLDIDHFKTINDTLGHDTGDELLKAFAAMLEKTTRSNDTVARMGGDEFVILLEGLENGGDAAVVADKILDNVKSLLIPKNNAMTIGTSIGIALYPADGEDNEALLKMADKAMYHSKSTGRNKYHFFNAINLRQA